MILFLLIHSTTSLEASCLKYACKPNSMIFKPGTCLYTKSSVAYLSPCKDSEYCPKVSKGNSTCILKPTTPDSKGYPGEACSKDIDCLYPDCRKGICTGKHWLESCEASFECNVGLYCNHDKVCWVQKDEFSRCSSDSECKNNMGCNFWSNSYDGECRRYFSLSNKEWVFNCEDHNSLFCHSGNCGGPGGKGVCIDRIKPRYLDPTCNSDDDCQGESFGWQFYSTCDCGANPSGQGYCRPFLGDYLGEQYISVLKNWFDSEQLQTCHTDLRDSPKCMSQWKDYKEYLVKYYEWRFYPLLRENSDCIKQTLNSFYWDLKEEEPKPPPEPVKPPNIFGGLAVKTPVVAKPAIKNVQTHVPVTQVNEAKTETVKNFKDPFEDLLTETSKGLDFQHLGPASEVNVWNDAKESKESKNLAGDKEINENSKKNDPNSIEFLLDLTMGEAKSSQNPAPVVIKKANVIRSEVSSELRKGNVGRNFENAEHGQANLFAGITNVRTAQRINELHSVNKNSAKNEPEQEKIERKFGEKPKDAKNRSKSRNSSDSEPKRPKPSNRRTEESTKTHKSPEKLEENTEKNPENIENPLKLLSESEENIKNYLHLKAEEEKAMQEAFLKMQEQETLARAEKEKKEAELLLILQENLRQEELLRLEEERKSAELRSNCDFLMNLFQNELESLEKLIQKLSSEQVTLKDVQKNYQSDLQEMQIKEKELENLASDAANSEDFDLAVQYSDERESLLLKIEFTTKDLQKKSEEYLAMEVEKSNIYKKIRTLFTTTESSIKQIIDSCSCDLEEKKSSLLLFSETLERKTETFTQDIQSKTLEVQTLQEALKDKKSEVQEKMKNRTEPLKEDKQKTENSLESVSKEIEEIYKVLNEKLANKDLLTEKLKSIEDELNGVDLEFSQEFQEIQAAEDLIQVETSELETLQSSSVEEKQRKEQEIEECKQAIQKITEKVTRTLEVHGSLEQKFREMESLIRTREESLAEIIKNREIVFGLKETLTESEKALKKLTEDVNSAQDELKHRENRIEEIKVKVPILESEKKTATANKLFKDAAKINNEIKEMTNELQVLIESTETLVVSLKEKRTDEEKVRADVLKHREEIETLNESIERMSQVLLV